MKCVDKFLDDKKLLEFQACFRDENDCATDTYFNIPSNTVDPQMKVDKKIVFLGSDKIQPTEKIKFPNVLLPMVMLFHKISSNKDKPYPSILHFYLKEIKDNYTTENNKQFIETSINNNCIFVIFHPKLKKLIEHNKDKYVTSDEYKQIEDANKDYKGYIIVNGDFVPVDKGKIIETSHKNPIILSTDTSKKNEYKAVLSELFKCYITGMSNNH